MADPVDRTLTITDDDERGLDISKASVTVTEASGAGNTATYTVALASRLTQQVAVALSSGDASAATVEPPSLTWVPGDWRTAKTVTVRGVDDEVDNTPDRTTAIRHSASGGDYASVTGSVSVIVTDDDEAVSLSASPNPVPEGSSVTVTATLTAALSSAVTIPVTLAAGTAESGDFGTLAEIRIRAGRTRGTGTITTTQDADTDDETFTVALGASLPSSVVAGSPSSVTVTISDDDGGGGTTPAVSLSASPNPVPEGSPVTVTARLSEALEGAVTIPLTVTAGTSEAGDHGTLSSITIGAGRTSGTGSISTANDADADDETFTVALGSLPSTVRAGNPSSVTVTILDDDFPEVEIAFDASSLTVSEGQTVAVDLILARDPGRAVRVRLVVTPGPGVLPTDYVVPDAVHFEAGETWKRIEFRAVDDRIDEDDEVVTLSLGSLSEGFVFGDRREVRIIIVDDDERGVIVIPTEMELVEGRSDEYRIGLTSQPTGPVTVSVAATPAGADVTVTAAALSFTPEDWWIQQPVLVGAAHDDDAVTDPTTTIRHRLTGGDYENFPAPTVTVVVEEDDRPTIAVADARASEGAGEIVFKVTLNVATDREVRVWCTTLAGTATEGLDYTRMEGTLVIPPLRTEAEIVVPLLDDTGDEPAETFTLKLSQPVNASQAPGSLTATGTILDDDMPEVAISAVASPVAEGADARFRFSRAGDQRVSLRVPIRVAETGSFMTGPAPSAVTFAAGEGEVVLALPTLDDALDERDGEIRATLAESPDYRVAGPRTAEVAITDNDAPPALVVTGASVPESAGAIEFPVFLRGASAYGVTVQWSTADLTATAGEDYEATTGTLILAPGETSGRVRIAVIDDVLPEEDETFTLILSSPENAVLEAGSATGTITDDDEAVAVAWLSRFGRTVASQVVDGVTDRLQGGLDRGGLASAVRQPPSGGPHGDRTSLRDVLARSSFLYSTVNDGRAGGGGGAWTMWGRGVRTEFSGADGDVAVEGSVLTGLAGVDYERGRVLAGVSVFRSLGDGTAGAASGPPTEGRVESALSGAYPYLRIRTAERMAAWALAGHGRGVMSFPGEGGEGNAIRMNMGAVGARGELLHPRGGGFGVALKSDAFIVRMSSEKGGGSLLLADSERARFFLEASGRARVGESGVFGSTVEVGVRHDGGDAETGTGLEMGGGLEYANAQAGLRVEASLRALVSHQDSHFREWGLAARSSTSPAVLHKACR